MNIKDISCIFYDFDGVMTDNRVLVDQNGMEYVYVNRSDGLGVAALKAAGVTQVIISTEDAEPEVKSKADWISSCKGGYGAVRDLYRELSKEEENK